MWMRLLAISASTQYGYHFLGICIIICAVIKYGYYPLSAYKVMNVLNYYLNLYAILNNALITICKLK
jgi:hypothetical protein